MDPFEIDIDEALCEFAAPSSPDPGIPIANREVEDPSGVPNRLDPGGPNSEGEWLPANEALCSESSDPDVIYIDLTQRPPSLPVSGLALEQLVSMLPGNTYAVSGSGIPMRTSPRAQMRTSPRADQRHNSVSEKSASKLYSAETDEACADDRTEISQDTGINADGARSSSGHAASNSPRSPQIALTFVPGLGILPIVIQDDSDEDLDEDLGEDGMEDEEEEEGEEERGNRAFEIEELHVAGDVASSISEREAGGEESNSIVGAQQAPPALMERPPHVTSTEDQSITEQAADPQTTVSDDRWVPSRTEASRTAESWPVTDPNLDSASGDVLLKGFPTRTHTNTEQQICATQQAVSGLDLQPIAAENNKDGHDHFETSTAVGCNGLASHGMLEMLLSLGKLPPLAGDGAERSSTFESALDQQPGKAGGLVITSSETGGVPGTAVALKSSQPLESTERRQKTDEDDDVINDGDESLDEVDDSGSGGGDEPECILGGLGHARRGFVADGVFLSNVSASVGQYASTIEEASGAHYLGTATRNAARDPSPNGGPGDPRSKGRLTDSSGVAGLLLPRPRYVAHNTARSYDGSYGTHADDLSSCGHHGKATTPAGIESTTDEESTHAHTKQAINALHSSYSSIVPEKEDGASLSTSAPAASSTASVNSNAGSNLNVTLRVRGQSLAAVRQAALQAEAHRQAKLMAERLGGGADGTADSQHSNPGSNRPERRISRSVSTGISNPFGCAEQEASAAAGLVISGIGNRRATRRSSGSSGCARVDGRHHHSSAAATNEDIVDDDWDADLEELLRDRSIIQPRYPTDKKVNQHHGKEGSDSECTDAHDLSSTMEADGAGSWRPRHRRSADVLDLDMLAHGEVDDGEPLQTRRNDSRERSDEGSAPVPSRTSRSLLATRKSDDGRQLEPPLASSSPRLGCNDSGSESSSSSAHSVADERLVDELEALREELGQKTTLVAGLRGELRKYTDLTIRLEQQLKELRVRGVDTTSAVKAAYPRSQSDAGALGNTPAAVAGSGSGSTEQLSSDVAAPLGVGVAPVILASSASQPLEKTSAGEALNRSIAHGLPPHPQAQGLEGPARLVLYTDILTKAQLQVGRSGGPEPPDLRDAEELLKGKEILDAGTEKVMLIKLQKIVTWGCEAAWKASVAQQQAKFREHAAQQAAQERTAWEAEREQLRQALEEARVAQSQVTSFAVHGSAGDIQEKGKTDDTEGDLRRQLQAAQDEVAVARDQAADLESAVALLNADVRKLKVQLRNSRDGGQEGSCGDAATDNIARADNRAWAMERKLLLTTIASLKEELEQARAASRADPVTIESSLDCHSSPSGSQPPSLSSLPPGIDPASKKDALADAALDQRMQQLQIERDTALHECTSLRRQLEEMIAYGVTDSGLDRSAPRNPGAEEESSATGRLCVQVEQLQRELIAARDALDRRTADAKAAVALHEQQSATLQSQVLELRQELALAAADLATAANLREEDRHALEARRAAGAHKDALIQELREQLMSFEVERKDIKAAFSKEMGEKSVLEEKLRQAREALASALLTAESANVAVEQSLATSADQLGPEHEEMIPVIDLEEALRLKGEECERLQRLVETRTHEIAHQELQLAEARATVTSLTNDASQTRQQLLQLQQELESMQQGRKSAAAEPGQVIKESEALQIRVLDLDDRLGEACMDESLWRKRAEQAEAAAATSREELSELRAYAAGLQAEARDLRTALSAEDEVQAQLRGQMECLEGELETQASLAQKLGDQAAKMKAALAEAQHQRHDTAAEAADRAAAVSAELRAAQGAAAEAQKRVLELEARLAGLGVELAEVADRSNKQLTPHETTLEQCQAGSGNQDAGIDLKSRELFHAANEPLQEQHAQGSDVSCQQAVIREAALDGLTKAERVGNMLCEDVSELRRQLDEGSVVVPAAGAAASAMPCVHDLMPQADERLAGQVVALRLERSRLEFDCMALQSKLVQLRSGQLGRVTDAETQVEVLRSQLQAARSDLQQVRADLQAANVELSVKGELMVAKDRSLATLQETVDALKLALHVTQQNLPPPMSSPRHAALESFASDGVGPGTSNLEKYRGTVVSLQSKFAESESTIRRLEKQVAALETRLSAEDALVLRQKAPSPPSSSERQLQSLLDRAALEQPLTEMAVENSRHLQELESLRGPTFTAAMDLGHGVGASPPHGLASGFSAESATAAAVNKLQLQVDQWRDVSEDLHARYQSKKETIRRLRDQLLAEQKRRADEQAQDQVQLETAAQRLTRLAMDLGTAIRRCIALDLQPLSAAALITSPRTMLGSGALPDDINALAALLARQGAVLIESLEVALGQVNTAREERAFLTAQLANRQAILDELRHHLADQTSAAAGRADRAVALGEASLSGISINSPSNSQASPRHFALPLTSRHTDIQQAGLRNMLQGFEQRLGQQSNRSRSMSAVLYPSGAATTQPLNTTSSYPAVSPLRSRANGNATDGSSAWAAAVPSGSPPHAYVGIISGSRVEPHTSLAAVSSTGGGLHSGIYKTYNVYNKPSLSSASPPAPPVDGSRISDSLTGAVGALRTPPRSHLLGSPQASAGSNDTSTGFFG